MYTRTWDGKILPGAQELEGIYEHMINSERLLNQFLDLVRIDSETKQEGAIARQLIKILSELGLEVTETETVPGHGAGNLVAVLKGTRPGIDPIFFTCHMDTVVPGKGIHPIVKDGYISSDGTTILGADDKAGLAALLEAIRVIQEDGRKDHGTIQVIITVGEESGLAGARHLDPTLISARYGFALDSDGPVGTIVTAAPSQAKMHVAIIGKSAHAGVAPEKGISAITVAAKAIAQMPLGRIDEDTTANIGRFEGGQATNIVCERADIYAEARSHSPAKLNEQINRMRTSFERTAREMGARAEVEVEIMYPAFRHGAESQLVQIAMEAAERIGRKPNLIRSGGGSDANIFNGMGIPTIVLGVGYEDIHTTKERIPVIELEKLAEQVLAIIDIVSGKK